MRDVGACRPDCRSGGGRDGAWPRPRLLPPGTGPVLLGLPAVTARRRVTLLCTRRDADPSQDRLHQVVRMAKQFRLLTARGSGPLWTDGHGPGTSGRGVVDIWSYLIAILTARRDPAHALASDGSDPTRPGAGVRPQRRDQGDGTTAATFFSAPAGRPRRPVARRRRLRLVRQRQRRGRDEREGHQSRLHDDPGAGQPGERRKARSPGTPPSPTTTCSPWSPRSTRPTRTSR